MAGRAYDAAMNDDDIRLRIATYRLFVEMDRVPTVDDVAAAVGLPIDEAILAWHRLAEAHAIVLEPGTNRLRMANPFSAVPTSHRVRVAGRWWFANCAWDAFGICAALHADGRIESTCLDCGERIDVEVRDRQPDDASLVFHCGVPAASWWDDIVFT